MSAIKRFLQQTAVYGVSTMLSRLFNFILTPLFTDVFKPSVYAVFTKMYASASLLNAVLAFGMETTFFRYLNKHESKQQEVYNNAFYCVTLLSVLFLVTGFVFTDSIAGYFAENLSQLAEYQVYVRLVIAVLVVDAISVIPLARVRADARPIRYSMLKFINIGCFIGLNLIFLFAVPWLINTDTSIGNWCETWYTPKWVGYVFLSNLMASSITLLMLIPELKKLQLRFDRPLFLSMISYSWPVLAANLSFVVNEHLDKMVIGKLGVSDHDLGVYGGVSKIAVFLSLFITAFRLGAEPFFFSHAKNKDAKQTYAVILYYFAIALGIIFVGIVANIELLKGFIDEAYYSGLSAVPFLLMGYVCLGIYSNLSIWYRLSDQTRYGLYISGIGAIVTIVLNFLLVPQYGYMGSAWVSFAAYFIMMVISYVLGQRNYPIPYELKKIAAYLGCSVLIVVLAFWVFERNIYIGNLLLLLFVASVFLIEKRKLTKLLR